MTADDDDYIQQQYRLYFQLQQQQQHHSISSPLRAHQHHPPGLSPPLTSTSLHDSMDESSLRSNSMHSSHFQTYRQSKPEEVYKQNKQQPHTFVKRPISHATVHADQNQQSDSILSSLTRSNVFIRWFVYITPLLFVLFIPGILDLAIPNSQLKILGVRLVWWSSWLAVGWLGWWIGLIIGNLSPHLFKHTLGVVLPPNFVERWYGFLSSVNKPIMGAVWGLLSWLTFQCFVVMHVQSGVGPDTRAKLFTILRVLFGIFWSTLMLVAEKLVIQIIASSFHKRSYEDRIDQQKRAIRALTVLYKNSHDIGRSDTLDRAYVAGLNTTKRQTKRPNEHSARIIKHALRGVKNAAKSTTTVFGTVASEIAGEKILQPNSPESVVLSSLSSSNKSRQLARRIYFSFVPTGYSDVLVLGDILHCFETDTELAREAFLLLDKDGNGDCSLQELELVCLELHRERLALASSMRDLDSAVGRLDSIFMFIWYFISSLIIVCLLDVSFQTMLASAGTLTLGLSWLIGTTAQEILASIIFLFIKHPYDVSDRVDVDGISYVVKEMHLLYTVFRQTDGKISQIPHSVLNIKTVINVRRSGSISEPFEWAVDFGTSFERIEELRSRMMNFVEEQSRDFEPGFDISIMDFEGQSQMSLQANINYKSNWQNGGLKSQRRNKWICALKQIMGELKIYGPAGAGNPNPEPEPKLIKLIDVESKGVVRDSIQKQKEKIDQMRFESDESTIIKTVRLNGEESVMKAGFDIKDQDREEEKMAERNEEYDLGNINLGRRRMSRYQSEDHPDVYNYPDV